MMTLWNAANGPSIHAELIGREWVKMGHKLKVFSAIEHPDARPTMQKDEHYVIRHFSVREVVPVTKASSFDASPLLEEDFEVSIAQNVERLPTKELLELYKKHRIILEEEEDCCSVEFCPQKYFTADISALEDF